MPVLLDTCAIIFRAEGLAMSKASTAAIDRAAKVGGVLISPVSAWEVALLSRPERRNALQLGMDPIAWFSRVLNEPGASEVELTYEIAIESTRLPGTFHRDPADRFLIATARALNVPLITRDEQIEAYAKGGHVRLITC